MEIPRHWRLKKIREGFQGYSMVINGEQCVSIDGIHWYKKELQRKNGNGHSGFKNENPFSGVVVYQAPDLQSVSNITPSSAK